MGNTIDGGFSHGLILRKKNLRLLHSSLYYMGYSMSFHLLFCYLAGTAVPYVWGQKRGIDHLTWSVECHRTHLDPSTMSAQNITSVNRLEVLKKITGEGVYVYMNIYHMYIYSYIIHAYIYIYIYTIPPRVSSSKSQPLAVVQRDFVVELSLVSLKFRIL